MFERLLLNPILTSGGSAKRDWVNGKGLCSWWSCSRCAWERRSSVQCWRRDRTDARWRNLCLNWFSSSSSSNTEDLLNLQAMMDHPWESKKSEIFSDKTKRRQRCSLVDQTFSPGIPSNTVTLPPKKIVSWVGTTVEASASQDLQ